MSRKKAVEQKESTVQENRFSGRALVESKEFAKVMWAATVVLDPDAYYTIAEAWDLVHAFINRKVG